MNKKSQMFLIYSVIILMEDICFNFI